MSTSIELENLKSPRLNLDRVHKSRRASAAVVAGIALAALVLICTIAVLVWYFTGVS